MTKHALDRAPKIGFGLALAILIAIEVVCYHGTTVLIESDSLVTLLDLRLSKEGAVEVSHRIHGDSRTKLLSVVVLTSSNKENDLINGYGLGCNSYIRKPVDFEKFVEAIRQLGLYWLALNETPSPPKG